MRFLPYTVLVLLALVFMQTEAKADALCPDPINELERVPSDMAAVQGDIDRYRLCVERASLLQELNTIVEAQERLLKNNKAVGTVNIDANFLPTVADYTGSSVGGLAPIKNLSEDKVSAVTDIERDLRADFENNQAKSQMTDWMIDKVSGKGGTLQARLISADGLIVTVTEGQTLPDGRTVSELTPSSVSLDNNGRVAPLRWYSE